MAVRSPCWGEGREDGAEGGREGGYWEGKGHRPKFLGSCSFSHSEKQRSRESDLETDTNRNRTMEIGKT